MSISSPDMMTLPIALVFGFLFGMGPCLLGCLPYLGPVFVSLDGGISRSWSILLPFSLGRLSAYTGFGLASGLAGHLAGNAISPNRIGLLLGTGTLLIAVGLLLRSAGSRRLACTHHVDKAEPALPGGLFLLGFSMALSPCTPLSAILLAAAASQSPLSGACLGFAFGIGALLVPSLIYGAGFSFFASQLREKLGQGRKYVEVAAIVLLTASGLYNIFRWGV
jgi:thiol:disulfide interchange protein DsbD